jgi:hypothetical protein
MPTVAMQHFVIYSQYCSKSMYGQSKLLASTETKFQLDYSLERCESLVLVTRPVKCFADLMESSALTLGYNDIRRLKEH